MKQNNYYSLQKRNKRIVVLLFTLIILVPYTRGQGSSTDKPVAKSAYAQVNGLKMYYEVYGTGKPLILIHGAFMTTSGFSSLIPGLTKNRQIIAVELQGHGHTADIDRPFSFEAMADDVAAMLKQLNLNSVDVFGYSMGGGVALQLAIRHPQLVRKLIIASAVYRHDGWSAETRAILPILEPQMFEGTPIKTEYVKVAPDPSYFPKFVNKMKQFITTPYDFTEGKVKAIKSPTLIIAGDGDGVLPEHAVELYRLRNGKYMVDFSPPPPTQLAIFPGTSHISVMMQTEWLLSMINPFLDANFQ